MMVMRRRGARGRGRGTGGGYGKAAAHRDELRRRLILRRNSKRDAAEPSPQLVVFAASAGSAGGAWRAARQIVPRRPAACRSRLEVRSGPAMSARPTVAAGTHGRPASARKRPKISIDGDRRPSQAPLIEQRLAVPRLSFRTRRPRFGDRTATDGVRRTPSRGAGVRTTGRRETRGLADAGRAARRTRGSRVVVVVARGAAGIDGMRRARAVG